MSNWCSNVLRVSGPPDQVAAFRDAVAGVDEEDGKPVALLFSRLSPPPDDLPEDRPADAGWYALDAIFGREPVTRGDWCSESTCDVTSGDGWVEYAFITRTSPPELWVAEAARDARWAGCRLELGFTEVWMGMVGLLDIKPGCEPELLGWGEWTLETQQLLRDHGMPTLADDVNPHEDEDDEEEEELADLPLEAPHPNWGTFARG